MLLALAMIGIAFADCNLGNESPDASGAFPPLQAEIVMRDGTAFRATQRTTAGWEVREPILMQRATFPAAEFARADAVVSAADFFGPNTTGREEVDVDLRSGRTILTRADGVSANFTSTMGPEGREAKALRVELAVRKIVDGIPESAWETTTAFPFTPAEACEAKPFEVAPFISGAPAR